MYSYSRGNVSTTIYMIVIVYCLGCNCCSNCCIITGILLVSVDSSSTTSLTILWTLDEGVTGTSYTISYENTNTDCFTMTYEDITTSVVTHELTGLEEGTEYSITVTTTLTGGGGTVSDTLTASTITVGEFLTSFLKYSFLTVLYIRSSICCSQFCECY